jgi:hypothetical protein
VAALWRMAAARWEPALGRSHLPAHRRRTQLRAAVQSALLRGMRALRRWVEQATTLRRVATLAQRLAG